MKPRYQIAIDTNRPTWLAYLASLAFALFIFGSTIAIAVLLS